MKFLFYDLEYATSRGGVSIICEFGYVVTDEFFNVLDRGNFIINPNIKRSEWDYRVVRKILTRPVKEYEFHPFFSRYYKKIKELFSSSDFIFGHSVDGDAKALNDNCKRYALSSIDHDFYDVKRIYRRIYDLKQDVSVVDMLSALNITGEDRIHDAETDAFNTMLELKEIFRANNLSPDKLSADFSDIIDRSEKYVVRSIYQNKLRKEEKRRELLKIKRKQKKEDNSKNVVLYDSTSEDPESDPDSDPESALHGSSTLSDLFGNIADNFK